MKRLYCTVIVFFFIGSATSENCITEEGFFNKYIPHTTERSFDKAGLVKLDGGGQADIYEIPKANSPIVLKRLKKISENAIQELKSEVEITNLFKDMKGVVRLYECVISTSWTGVVMEKLYKNLYDVADEIVKLDFDKKLNLYALLALYVENMHEAGYVHNDIKHLNVMVTDKTLTDVRLIDMGITCKKDEICDGGTKEFSPPEKILVKNKIKGHYSLDSWAILMTIAFVENLNNYSVLAQNLKTYCDEGMILDYCYKAIVLSAKSMLAKSQPELRNYVLNSLTFEPTKRPTASRIFEDLKQMQITISLQQSSKLLKTVLK